MSGGHTCGIVPPAAAKGWPKCAPALDLLVVRTKRLGMLMIMTTSSKLIRVTSTRLTARISSPIWRHPLEYTLLAIRSGHFHTCKKFTSSHLTGGVLCLYVVPETTHYGDRSRMGLNLSKSHSLEENGTWESYKDHKRICYLYLHMSVH